MYDGLAGALLVMSGIWHATEYLMGGRTRDSMRLVPVGIVYVILGILIVSFIGGTPVLWTALVVASLALVTTYANRRAFAVKRWVIRLFILLDLVIVFSLVAALALPLPG